MKYKILPGHSFRDSDNSVKGGGDLIDLDDDAAKQHADKIEAAAPDAVDAATAETLSDTAQ